jgi:hypothetical protein
MVAVGFLAYQLVIYYLAIPFFAWLLGRRSRDPAMRWLGAVGGAALAWIGIWGLALLIVFGIALGVADGRGGNPELSELYPALVPALLGPIVGALVLRRLWLRAVREKQPRP